MNSNISSSRLKLPLKISGIVFWGLACIGTIVTGVFLTTLNMKVKEQNKQTYRLVQFQVEQYIAAHPKINRSEFEQYLASSRDYLLVEGLQVSIKDNAKDNAKYDVYLSVKDDFDIRKTDPFPPADKKDQSTDEEDQSADEEDQFISASGMQLIIYFKNLEQENIQTRRYVLIGLFILFSTFGMVLTWVLRSMLTKPFLQMVDTAEKFSSGDTTVRFDETRDDEFAYMASFVNKALDQLLTKHRELEAALEKVQDSESALFEEKERLEVTLHSIGDAVVSTNAQVVVEYLNPAAEILTGWRCEQASVRT